MVGGHQPYHHAAWTRGRLSEAARLPQQWDIEMAAERTWGTSQSSIGPHGRHWMPSYETPISEPHEVPLQQHRKVQGAASSLSSAMNFQQRQHWRPAQEGRLAAHETHGVSQDDKNALVAGDATNKPVARQGEDQAGLGTREIDVSISDSNSVRQVRHRTNGRGHGKKSKTSTKKV